jgi:hypothetical protein
MVRVIGGILSKIRVGPELVEFQNLATDGRNDAKRLARLRMDKSASMRSTRTAAKKKPRTAIRGDELSEGCSVPSSSTN